MATYVGKLNIQLLDDLSGAPSSFITYLASNANRIGSGCALGFYVKHDMEAIIKGYTTRYEIDQVQLDELRDWIDALPWDENERLALAFNW